MAPKIVKLIGNNSHCKIIQSHLYLPYCGGLGGNKITEMIAEEMRPSIASSIMVLVMNGRLNDKTVRLKILPPTNIGSQPRRNMMIGLVDEEWVFSVMVNLK